MKGRESKRHSAAVPLATLTSTHLFGRSLGQLHSGLCWTQRPRIVLRLSCWLLRGPVALGLFLKTACTFTWNLHRSPGWGLMSLLITLAISAAEVGRERAVRVRVSGCVEERGQGIPTIVSFAELVSRGSLGHYSALSTIGCFILLTVVLVSTGGPIHGNILIVLGLLGGRRLDDADLGQLSCRRRSKPKGLLGGKGWKEGVLGGTH